MVRFLMPVGVAGIVAVTVASFTSTPEDVSKKEHVSLFEQLTSFRSPLQTPSVDDLVDRSEELAALIPSVGGRATLVLDESGIAVCDRDQEVLECINFASLAMEDVFEAFQFGEVTELDENSFAVPLLTDENGELALLGDFGEGIFDGGGVSFAAAGAGIARGVAAGVGAAAGGGGSVGGGGAAGGFGPFGGATGAPGGSVADLVAAVAGGGVPGAGGPIVSGAISPAASSVLSVPTATPTDPATASTPPIAPVPAPMGAVLLLTGLGVLSLRKRRS